MLPQPRLPRLLAAPPRRGSTNPKRRRESSKRPVLRLPPWLVATGCATTIFRTALTSSAAAHESACFLQTEQDRPPALSPTHSGPRGPSLTSSARSFPNRPGLRG